MNKGKSAFYFITALLLAYIVSTVLLWDTSVRNYEARFISNDTNVNGAVQSGRIFLDNDAYYWVTFAREMVRTGNWRIRHTDVDNVPYGRSVHWSQSVSWLLVMAGAVQHVASGMSMDAAIEHASIWVGPLQMMLLLVATGVLLYRRMGTLPAIVWMVNLGTMTIVQWYFHPLRPDHHGLQISFLLGSLLCLMLGGLGWANETASTSRAGSSWFRAMEVPDHITARRYFIASGILGGLGIWTGATVQLFGIGLVALGAMMLIFFMPPGVAGSSQASIYQPGLWRLWAITGAITSLVFYFIEYAPDFPGMRLEVNHPLYALSWFCAGECMTRLSSMKSNRVRITPAICVPVAVFAAVAAILPVLLWIGPAGWHSMHDPHMQRMHTHILEFLPYARQFNLQLIRDMFLHFGFLPAFLIVAPMLTGANRTKLYEWALLWMAFMPALAYAILIQLQVRWAPFFIVTSLLLTVVTLVIFARHQADAKRPLLVVTIMTIALLAQPGIFLRGQVREFANMRKPGNLVNDLAKPILQRQFCARMGDLNTNGTFRVMCEPDMAARLFYYGGIPSVTSYYWENLEGLVDAVNFMTDAGNEVPARIIRERGITHVVLPRMPKLAHIFYYIKTGTFSEAGARDSMAGRLMARSKSLPPWIKRDQALMKELQPGYRFHEQPVFNTLEVFVIHPEHLDAGAEVQR